MKKTMFITSVIMVVVMAIALTTSSLAWFTAGGGDYVTTNTLKVTAQGMSSSGIAISHDAEQWDTTITLTSTGTSGLNALVPFTGVADLDALLGADGDTNDLDDAYEALLAALMGGAEDKFDASTSPQTYGTAANNTPYDAKMIGAKIDSNRNFTSDVMRSGYYVDTLYLKNLAGGTGAANIKFDVDIKFGFHKIVSNENTYFAYNSTNRGASQYQEDAVLCVAVLAKVGEFDTDANIDEGYEPGHEFEAPNAWEIIGYADSKGRNVINVGLDYNAFKQGAASANSFDDLSIDTLVLNKTNYDELRPERVGESGRTLAADIKTIKVIAWYDGSTLNNNNSTKMDLEFDLQFNRKILSGNAWVDPS